MADSRWGASRSASGCPEASASYGGGLHFPYAPGALYHFETPLTFAACKAVTLGDAEDGCLTDPEKIAVKLHAAWGHVAAQQSKRVLAHSVGNNMHLLARADEAMAQCEVCQAFEQAPHIPVGGTSTVAMFSEKLRADSPFSDDIIAPHVVDVFSKYSPLIPVRTKNPQEARDAGCSPWIGIFGPP